MIVYAFPTEKKPSIFTYGNARHRHVISGSLLRAIFVSLVRSHERVHVQNVGDFPQTKLYEHGDPRFFSGIC